MRASSRAILLLLTATVAPAALGAEVTVTKLRQAIRLSERGNRALEAGNANRARELYVKAVERVPELPEPHLGLGHVAMRERNFEEALREYRLARDGYVSLGDALHGEATRRYERAQQRIVNNRIRIVELRSAAPVTPQEAAAIQRAIARLEQETMRLELIEVPRTEVGEARIPAEVYFYIGNALGNLDDLDGATKAWETCRERNPRFAPVHNNLAAAYLRAGRLDEASACLERAEELGLDVNPALKADIARGLRLAQDDAGDE